MNFERVSPFDAAETPMHARLPQSSAIASTGTPFPLGTVSETKLSVLLRTSVGRIR